MSQEQFNELYPKFFVKYDLGYKRIRDNYRFNSEEVESALLYYLKTGIEP